jgi:hypothetical protein
VRRSLVRAEFALDESGQPVLRCVCDCGLATEVFLAGLRIEHGAVQEMAYTCDHCQTSHWFTVAISVEELPPEEEAGHG